MNFKSFALLFALSFISLQLAAQNDRPNEADARRDLDYYNSDRPAAGDGSGGIWYGGGFQLGFSSNNFESIFQIGISPIVGYKITPWLSAGPRASLLYNAYSVDLGAGRERTSYFTYAGGVFVRAKAFQQFFAHVEYNLENDVIGFNNATLDPIRRTRSVPYIGGGLVQGGGLQGGVGFELMILFPITEREFINDSPFIIRSGITVNF